jgi:hypothetical protein
VPPDIDVIQYFVNPPSLIPQRSDKTFRFQYLQPPPNINKRTFIAVPSYGRKSGSIAIKHSGFPGSVGIAVFGVRFVLSSAGSTIPEGIETTIAASASLAPGATRFVQFSSAVNGNLDYIYIRVVDYPAGAALPIVITLSDDL